MSDVTKIVAERPRPRDVSREELETVVGGIETIPLPEAIGTWPTPERPREPWFRTLSRLEL